MKNLIFILIFSFAFNLNAAFLSPADNTIISSSINPDIINQPDIDSNTTDSIQAELLGLSVQDYNFLMSLTGLLIGFTIFFLTLFGL